MGNRVPREISQGRCPTTALSKRPAKRLFASIAGTGDPPGTDRKCYSFPGYTVEFLQFHVSKFLILVIL